MKKYKAVINHKLDYEFESDKISYTDIINDLIFKLALENIAIEKCWHFEVQDIENPNIFWTFIKR